MSHVEVLGFETNLRNCELFAAALQQKQVEYVLRCVPLKRGSVPPIEEDFRQILEQHRPKILITSWRHIGPVVRKAERTMAGTRPLEKWIVSGYSTQELEEQEGGPISWADMIYEEPISPYFLAEEVERRLSSLLPRSSIIVPA